MTPTMIIMAISRKMTFMSMACLASSKLNDPVLREEGSRRVSHRQHEGCTQKSRQSTVHQFEGNEAVNGQENYGGNPESRSDGPCQTHVLMG